MWARCRASSSRPCLTACQTLSSSRRCPTKSRSVGLGVDAQFDFLGSLGLPSGNRLGPRPYRECAFSIRNSSFKERRGIQPPASLQGVLSGADARPFPCETAGYRASVPRATSGGFSIETSLGARVPADSALLGRMAPRGCSAGLGKSGTGCR